jgi:hypothetical protein
MYSRSRVKLLFILLFCIPILCGAQTDLKLQYLPEGGCKFLGLNTKYHKTLIDNFEASDLSNVLINLDGSVEKRPGCQLVTTISDSPVEIYTYKKNNGNLYMMAHTDTRVLYSTDGINFTTLVNGLIGGKEMCFITVSDSSGNDSVVFCDGVNYRYCWNGTTLNTFTSAEQVKFEKAVFFQGRIWGADSGTYATRIYYSTQNNPDSFTNYNYLVLSFPAGERCLGIQPLTRLADDITSYLLVFSKTTTWGIKNTAAAISAASVYPIFTDLGSLSHYANVNIEGVQQIPTRKGIIGFSGSNLSLLSDKVEPTYNNLGQVLSEKYSWTTSTTGEFLEGETFTNIDTTTDGQISYGGTFGYNDGWTISWVGSYWRWDTGIWIWSWPMDGTRAAHFRSSVAANVYYGSIGYILNTSDVVLCTKTLSTAGGSVGTKNDIYVNTWAGQNIKLRVEVTFSYGDIGYCTSPIFTAPSNTISIYLRYIDTTLDALDVDMFRPETATYISKVYDTTLLLAALSAPIINYNAGSGTVSLYIRSSVDNLIWNDTTTPYIKLENGVEPNTNCNRYLQYKVCMASDSAASLPIVYDVTINWTGGGICEASLQGIQWNDYYLLAGATIGANKNNIVIARNYKNGQFTKFDTWRVRRWTEFKDGLYFGSALDDGKIYRAWTGYNDAGSAITAYYQAKTQDFGISYDKKGNRFLNTTVGTSSIADNIKIYWTADDGQLSSVDTIPLYSANNRTINLKRTERNFDFYNMSIKFYHDTLDTNFKIYKYIHGLNYLYPLKGEW